MWTVEEVSGLQGSDQLRPLWAGQSPSNFKEESCGPGVKSKAKASTDNPMSRAELRNVLSQHSQELMASLSQTLTPLIQGQMMLQEQMGYVMSTSSATSSFHHDAAMVRNHSCGFARKCACLD